MSRAPGTRWRHYATAVLVTGAVLTAAVLAGCSSRLAAAPSSVTSCYQFAARAIQHHVTVTVRPAACQGLSQVQVNVAVSRALRAAAAGVRGKVPQRQVITRDSAYVAGLIHAVPASSPIVVTAPQSPQSRLPGQTAVAAPQSRLPGQTAVATPQSRLPGQTAVAAPQSRPPSRAALSLAALIAWLVTVGLGLSMMARWLTLTRRPGTPRRRGRGPVLNLTHFGLALTGLLAWISYLATGLTGLAWTACGLLLAVASLGMTLVFLPQATTTATARFADDPPPAGHPPVPVAAAHITAACVTILLATLAAIGAG